MNMSTDTGSSNLQSLRYTPSTEEGGPLLAVLDQRQVPHNKVYLPVEDAADAWRVIREMNVRGAPLIAMVAMLGLAVEVHKRHTVEGSNRFGSAADAHSHLLERLAYLRTSRPTAVNLFNACTEMTALLASEAAQADASGSSLVGAFVTAAEAMLVADVRANEQQGALGMEAILLATQRCREDKVAGREGKAKEGGVSVLTHCNTGSLATAHYGTALGVVRSLHKAGKLDMCYCTETRPYNQGARLTAFELVEDGIPATLITDSMASFLMAKGKVDGVVVGADRVVANGDTANKIGTYQLAVTAQFHKVPFFVVAPVSTLDVELATGDDIVIEERPGAELRAVSGVKAGTKETCLVQVAPEQVEVWNPAFDVTPAALITAIVTEKGVLYPQPLVVQQQQQQQPERGGGAAAVAFDVASLLLTASGSGPATPPPPPPPPSSTSSSSSSLNPPGYFPLLGGKVSAYLAGVPHVAAMLGASDVSDIEAKEIGDGNLNLVFLCRGPRATVVVKQALPYIRCVGESWPLTIDRAFNENSALVREWELCPEHVPEVFHFDRQMATIVQRYIEPPHLILRQGLIQGHKYTTVASDMAAFLARTLFFTSSLHLDGPSLRLAVLSVTSAHPLCALTEQVVFTDPYIVSDNNRWISPQLDETVASIKADLPLKLAVAALKEKFLHSTEALIHGDLHTGSIMVKEGSTFCIDPEFAFYGPMGFDIGALLGNLLLAFFARPGREGVSHTGSAVTDDGRGGEYADWILEQVQQVWKGFSRTFLALWEERHSREVDQAAAAAVGDAATAAAASYPSSMFGNGTITEGTAGAESPTPPLAAVQDAFLRGLWRDTLGFAGAKMIRRIIGIAHVEDLESITDANLRAACEERALSLARSMVTSPELFEEGGVDELVSRARAAV